MNSFTEKKDQSAVNSHIYFKIDEQGLVLKATDNEIGLKISHGENISISEDNLHLVDYNLPTINRCNYCGYICDNDFEYCPKCGQKL